MTFSESISTCLKKYADFKGRARRSEYWWFIVFQVAVGFALGLLAAVFGVSEDGVNGLSGVFGLAILLPSIAVTTRRLHDVSRSGWWQLIPITIVGVIPMLYWLCRSSDAQPNEYGPAV
jgi:uncharacterized membrane protein YhaH (DUF805 family)